jgi:FkbM family methyltransferase
MLPTGRREKLTVKIAKRLATHMLQRLDIVVPVHLTSGDVLYVDLANAVGRTIWFRKTYLSERHITALVESCLQPGDVFFDVGANVGFFSLVACRKVGQTGAVHAFEPLRQVATLIRRTVAANHVTNMTVVEAAVGKRSGVAQMASMTDSGYSHLLEGASHIDAQRGGWHAVSVKTVSLDEYVDQVVRTPPRLIKIDIEGAELQAFGGARSTLSDPAGPDVICEVGAAQLARFGHHPNEVFDLFESLGYAALDPENGLPIHVEDLSVLRYNVFFKKRNR